MEIQRDMQQSPVKQDERGSLPVDLTLADDLLAVCEDNVIVWVTKRKY